MSIPSVPPIPGIPTPTLLTYADLVTVNMDESNDVNIADTGDYGHRVQVTLGKTLFNLYFRWHRDVGQDRPHAKLSTSDVIENTFKSVLIESLNSSYMDIDGVTGGLHFSTANLSLNNDPRLRKNGLVSANDIPMAFVMYRLYGNSAFSTKNFVFNLQDAHDMLTSETVADAIIASFKEHETGALDKMFRDLLSQDPRRFFDENGHQEPNLFETATDLAGNGSWKLIENDIVEIKTKLIFHSNVTKRGVAGREHLLSDVNEAENQQKIIVPDDYFYIRLQLKIVDDGTIVDPTNLIYSDSTKTVVTGYTGSITGELIIPEGATSIATGAFKNQVGLTSVLFPQSLTSIGTEAFMNTGLVEVFLPNVTSIGASGFKNSTALTTVLAPNLTSIGANAFEGCTALESLNGTSSIPGGARGVGDIPGIIQTNPIINLTNITSLGASTFTGCTSIQDVTIPITFTALPAGVFSGCTNITSITIPTSVTSLGSSAFAGTGLTSITLHSGLTIYGTSVFSGCASLTSVTLLAPILTLPSGIFLNCSSITSVTLPSSLLTIAAQALQNTRITTITLPNVVTIGSGAFAQNPALLSVIAPSAVNVASDAFTGCSNVTNVPADLSSLTYSDETQTTVTGYTGSFGVLTFPASVTAIADSAFLNNSNVIGVTIPSTLQTIGANAFKGSGLKSITLPSTLTSVGNNAFQNCLSLTTITFPGANIASLGNFLFAGCTGLTSATVPSGMTSIPASCFNSCTNLASVTLHDGVSSIGSYAFSACTSISSFTIPAGLTTLSSYTFNLCTGLTAITLPSTLMNYQAGCFYGCTGLTSIAFPSVTTTLIGDQALAGCTGLTSVTFPNKGSSGMFPLTLGTSVLLGCSGLTSMTIPNQWPSLPNGFFENCSGLTSIEVPSTITSMGTGVFKGCSGLTSATVNAAITTLPTSTFLNCTSLASILLASSIITIDAQAFRNTRLTTFINFAVKTINALAFADNPTISSTNIPNLDTLDTTAFDNTPALLEKPQALVRSGAGSVPVDASGNMIEFGYNMTPSNTDDFVVQIPPLELQGFTFNINGTNYGTSIYASTNLSITFGSGATLAATNTYALTSAHIGFALAAFDRRSNRIRYFRSTLSDFDILTLQYWFENTPIGISGTTDFFNSVGQYQVRLIKQLSNGKQWVETRIVKGSGITTPGQWAIARSSTLTNASSTIDVSVATTFATPATILYSSDLTGTSWTIEKNRYINANNDNSIVNPSALIATVAIPLSSGTGTVPLTSGNMTPAGYGLLTTPTDNGITSVPFIELYNFTFYFNGLNYATSIFASTNLNITFLTAATSTTYAITSSFRGFSFNGFNSKTNRINYFRSSITDYEILTIQYWFENTNTGTSGDTDFNLSDGQLQVRLIKQTSTGTQFVEVRVVKGSNITTQGQWAIAIMSTLIDVSNYITTTPVSTFATPATIVYVSEPTGNNWQVVKGAYVDVNNDNSVVNPSFYIATVEAPLVSGAGTVPLTSGNMTPAGYALLTTPTDDGIITVPAVELTGFTFNINSVNRGTSIFASTNLNITFGTAATSTTYAITSSFRGFSFNGFNSKTNRINFFRSSLTDYEILTIQYWFENTNTGVSGATDFNLSDGQLQVRLIKRVSTGTQFVEVRVVKGSNITTQGQWAYASTSSVFDASNYITTTPATTFATPATIVYVSGPTGTVWQFAKGAYVDVNNDNSVVNPSFYIATVAAPLASGTGTVPLTSENMTPAGYELLTTPTDDGIITVPAVELTGFTFNINSVNRGTSIFASTNLNITFGNAAASTTYSLASSNRGFSFNGFNSKTNRINYFRSSITDYEIVTLQYWFENTNTGTSGATDFSLSDGQLQVRLIKQVSTGAQFVEVRTVKGVNITTQGQWAYANLSSVLDVSSYITTTPATTFATPATIVYVSDATGTNWKVNKGAYVNVNNDNSVVNSRLLVSGTGTVPLTAGNMIPTGYGLINAPISLSVFGVPEQDLAGFTFNMNGTNYGTSIFMSTNLCITLGTPTSTGTYSLATIDRGFTFNAFGSKANKITYFRSSVTDYEILTFQYWFENSTGGTIGGTDYNLSPGQLQVRLIKQVSTGIQYVEIRTVKGSGITTQGQWAIANTTQLLDMSTIITTTPATTFATPATIVYVSDATGTTWTAIKGAYVDVNNDNSVVNPSALIATVAAPLVSGPGTVPLTSGNMTPAGYELLATRTDDSIITLPSEELTGFIFNMNGVNYGTSIFASTNLNITLGTATLSYTYALASSDRGFSFNSFDSRVNRINYFRSSVTDYEILTLQYWFENTLSAISGQADYNLSDGQLQVRLIKRVSTGVQFVEIRVVKGSNITTSGQWAIAKTSTYSSNTITLIDSASYITTTPATTFATPATIVYVSDATGTNWQVVKNAYVNVNNDNSVVNPSIYNASILEPLTSGLGTVPLTSGNMTPAGYTLLDTPVDNRVLDIPSLELTGFVFNMNGVNYGTSISLNTNLIITLLSSTALNLDTYSLIAGNRRGFSFNSFNSASNKINYFRSTLTDYDIITVQYWFENSTTINSDFNASAGQLQVRLIKQTSTGKQFVEIRIVKGAGITTQGEWVIANGSTAINASKYLITTPATTFATPATIVYVSDASGANWQFVKGAYVDVNNDNSVVNASNLIATIAAPLVTGAGTVPLTSDNMTPTGYGLLTTPTDDSIITIPALELSGFTFNINNINRGTSIFVSTNLNITFGTAASSSTYSLASFNRGFSFNGFNSRANRINFFRSSVTDYEILTFQYWFENTTTGISGQSDYTLSDGQLQVRFIKQTSTGTQFVEIRTVKGVNITTQGQWAIANTSTLFNASTYLTTTPATTFATPATIVYISDATGTNWQVVKGAYVDVNNDNSAVNPFVIFAAPLSTGIGTVPLTSGNLTRSGAPIISWTNDDRIIQIPAGDLTGFTFNIRGTAHSSIFVSSNLALSFGTTISNTLYSLGSTNVGVSYGMKDVRTNRLTYFRSSPSNYEILTIQYWFENSASGTSGGSVNFNLSAGQLQVRLIKEISTGKQFIEIRTVKGSGITGTPPGQWALAIGNQLIDAVTLLGLTASNIFATPGSVLWVSDSTGTNWAVLKDSNIAINNDNSIITASSVFPTEMIGGTGVVSLDASGNMTTFGTILNTAVATSTSYSLPTTAAGTSGFVFNMNSVNAGGNINVTTTMCIGLGASSGIVGTTTSLTTAMTGFNCGGFSSRANRIAYLRTTTASYDILSIQWYFENSTIGITGSFATPTTSSGQMRVRLIKKLTGTQTQFVEMCFIKGSSTALTAVGTYTIAPGSSGAGISINSVTSPGLGTTLVAADIRNQNTAITLISDPNGTRASWTPYYNYYVNV